MGERGKTKGREGPSREPGLPFPLCLPYQHGRSCQEWRVCLSSWGRALASFSKWVHPILHRWMVRRAREPSCDPLRSRQGSDHTSVTVDDVSSILDRSGCRMLVLVFAFEG